MKNNARHTAYQALLHMAENEGYSHIVIDKALREAGLDSRDAGLASTLFYGVLEKRLPLEYFLRGCLQDPKKKVDPAVWVLLQCAAYQILYLDRVPAAAAVNEAVQEAKTIKKDAYTGLVNGVLRSLCPKKPELSLPEGDSLRALSLRYSIPEDLIALWQRSYGRELTGKLLAYFQLRPVVYVRRNPLRATEEDLSQKLLEEGFVLRPLVNPAGAAILDGEGSPAGLASFQEGLFHVQDLSAQLACQLLEPRPGQRLADCCAAPGGKTFTLAEMLENTGVVYSFDLYKGRVRLIRQGAKRLGLSCVEAQLHDGTLPYENLPPLDGVLCDVPCSGYGVIRRKPEIRYKPVSSTRELPKLQYTILEHGAALVRPGGLLVYSTCTLHPAENGEVAERFLQEHPEFEPAPFQLPEIQRCVEEPLHTLTLFPFSGGSDGFYVARFRRKEEL